MTSRISEILTVRIRAIVAVYGILVFFSCLIIPWEHSQLGYSLTLYGKGAPTYSPIWSPPSSASPDIERFLLQLVGLTALFVTAITILHVRPKVPVTSGEVTSDRGAKRTEPAIVDSETGVIENTEEGTEERVELASSVNSTESADSEFVSDANGSILSESGLCTACGKSVKGGSRYCPFCGISLGNCGSRA